MRNRLDRAWRCGRTKTLVLAVLLLISTGLVTAQPQYLLTDAVPAPLYSATALTAGSLELAAARWAIAGPLAYKDLKAVEREAQALSAEHIRLLGSPEEVAEPLPGDGFWGSWGEWATCPAGSYVCAVWVRIEGKQGLGDDTAMNGIRLKCCSLGSAPSPSAGLLGQ